MEMAWRLAGGESRGREIGAERGEAVRNILGASGVQRKGYRVRSTEYRVHSTKYRGNDCATH
jgi:hypothetical protein